MIIKILTKKENAIHELVKGGRWATPKTREEAVNYLESKKGQYPYDNMDGWVTRWIHGNSDRTCLRAKVVDGKLIVQYPSEGEESVFDFSSQKQIEQILIRETAETAKMALANIG